jgi:hypothetical protein
MSDIVAGMRDSGDLDFINIADITSCLDIGTMVSIGHANIVVNVFHLLQSQKDLAQPSDFLKRTCEGESIAEEDEMPQAKVICLPSKDFQGIWNTYAINLVAKLMS